MNIYISTFSHASSDFVISADKSLRSTYMTVFSATIVMSCHAKAYKFNLALSQDKNPYQTEIVEKR